MLLQCHRTVIKFLHKLKKNISFEPDLNQRPMDIHISKKPTTVHRSTN